MLLKVFKQTSCVIFIGLAIFLFLTFSVLFTSLFFFPDSGPSHHEICQLFENEPTYENCFQQDFYTTLTETFEKGKATQDDVHRVFSDYLKEPNETEYGSWDALCLEESTWFNFLDRTIWFFHYDHEGVLLNITHGN